MDKEELGRELNDMEKAEIIDYFIKLKEINMQLLKKIHELDQRIIELTDLEELIDSL